MSLGDMYELQRKTGKGSVFHKQLFEGGIDNGPGWIVVVHVVGVQVKRLQRPVDLESSQEYRQLVQGQIAHDDAHLMQLRIRCCEPLGEEWDVQFGMAGQK